MPVKRPPGKLAPADIAKHLIPPHLQALYDRETATYRRLLEEEAATETACAALREDRLNDATTAAHAKGLVQCYACDALRDLESILILIEEGSASLIGFCSTCAKKWGYTRNLPAYAVMAIEPSELYVVDLGSPTRIFRSDTQEVLYIGAGPPVRRLDEDLAEELEVLPTLHHRSALKGSAPKVFPLHPKR